MVIKVARICLDFNLWPNRCEHNSTAQEGKLGNGCKDAGGHYNPEGVDHGGLGAAVRHQGDFGNIVADSAGLAVVSITKAGTNLTAIINRWDCC